MSHRVRIAHVHAHEPTRQERIKMIDRLSNRMKVAPDSPGAVRIDSQPDRLTDDKTPQDLRKLR